MKKIILSVLLVSVVSLTSFGQIRFDFGIKGGPNFSSINTSQSVAQNYSSSNRTGYHLGAYAMLKITKFAIQPEVIFSRQGHNFSLPNTSTLNSSFDYINVPIMFKFYIAAGLNIQTGPQFGFLAKASGDLFNAASSTVSSRGVDLKSLNALQTSDFSWGVGAGWDLPFGLNVTARYNIGLKDVNRYTGSQIPSGLVSSMGTAQAKNQVFQFSVGYRLFKIGK